MSIIIVKQAMLRQQVSYHTTPVLQTCASAGRSPLYASLLTAYFLCSSGTVSRKTTAAENEQQFFHSRPPQSRTTTHKANHSTKFGTINLDYTQAAPGITQDILDKGTVLVYGKLNGYTSSLWLADQTAQLPIQVYYKIGSTTNIDTWSAFPSVGNLRINLVSSTNAYVNDQAITHNHAFRYVIIPEGTKLGLVNGGSVSKMGYAELCNTLHIPQ
ncbi:MAG: hypothetical protein M9933_07380 [Chitinophagaceae bacterium]|nr:hypothetical protein [Chitinophagaceae bacterium]